MQDRREFLKHAIAAGTLAGVARAGDNQSPADEWPIVFFEKPVQSLSYDEIGENLAAMGAQGIEASIRRNGHIKPENAAREVPGMIKSLAKAGLHTVIATTDVVEATAANSDFLNVLKDNGITCYRLGSYRYDNRRNPMDQVAGIREKIVKLAELNESLGMQGIYQLHSGSSHVGSLVWDIVGILKGVDPDALGLAYDLRHTRNDTGSSWKQAAAIARKHIRSIFIKDAKWAGERTNQRLNVPLDTGFVSQDVFDHVRKGLKPMPLSLHMEWGRHQVYPKETAREAWPMIRRDMEVLKKWRG